MTKARLYYEAHITCDPVFGTRRVLMEMVMRPMGFRVAKLLMRKREGDAETPHEDDSFCTGRSTDLEILTSRTKEAIVALRKHGFVVRRYKIEDTLLDSKIEGDPLEVLQ